MRLFLRFLHLTLFPSRPTGPSTARRMGILFLFVPLFLVVQTLHWVGLLLDEIFFRGFRRVEVREPLFIVGLPRSGTSFLQRVFAGDTDRFTTLRLWELLLAPSVTERKIWLALGALDRGLGRPMARLMAWGEEHGFGWMEAIHQVSLTDPEEDYFLLLPAFACFLLVVPFPYLDEVWALTRFDQLPPEDRTRLLRFYRAALQRHLYVVGPGKQLLSKNPSFTPMVASLAEAFPDSRILCCIRDPVKVVPSLLSSIRSGSELFGYDVAEPRIRDRFVEMLAFFSAHALEVLPKLPENRQAFAPMETMKADVEGFVLGIYQRFGWEPTEEFRERLRVEARKGEKYKSRHRYTLQEFGLGPEELDGRFPALRARFGYGQPGTGPDTGSGG